MNQIFFILALILLIIGTLFVLLASIGILRMPDLYSRMQTATKASTFGSICCILAVALHYQEMDVLFRVIGISAFLFLTAPIAAHILCRAGIISRVPLSDEHVVNELAGAFAAVNKNKDKSDT